MSDDTPEHGNTISGDIHASKVTGKGVAIGHGAHTNVYEDPDYPYDVRGLENPYLGLAAFTYDDRAIYAGRERATTEAVSRLITPGEQRVSVLIRCSTYSRLSLLYDR